ncbi:hypothetical protein [Actinomadura oligospora]|uniref:hypothetical protein n=1 Tax=Actinomadura oligospora TaxID=111804 RepID=UPI0004B181F2|nr:hypothetical protein [Actinomadura oligospora]
MVSERHVEWSVDEDILWGRNTDLAAVAEPGFWLEGDKAGLRGRLHLTEDGAAVLEMGEAQILFDVAAAPPRSVDGAWVQIRVAADCVGLWPYQV